MNILEKKFSKKIHTADWSYSIHETPEKSSGFVHNFDRNVIIIETCIGIIFIGKGFSRGLALKVIFNLVYMLHQL